MANYKQRIAWFSQVGQWRKNIGHAFIQRWNAAIHLRLSAFMATWQNSGLFLV